MPVMWQMRMPAKGFPGSSDGKESAFSAGDPGSIPGLGRSWRRERLPTPVSRPGEFHELSSPWVHKELDMAERLSLSHSVPELPMWP